MAKKKSMTPIKKNTKPASKQAAPKKKIVARASKNAAPAKKSAPGKPAAPRGVSPIPEGFRTITPYLIVSDCARAIEWYGKAFGAERGMTCTMPGSDKIAHADIKIGDSMLMLSGEWPDYGALSPISLNGTPVAIHLYVVDVDRSYQRAVAAGATVVNEPADQFWGDRFAKIKDPFGHQWSIATHKEDVSEEEIKKRGEQWMAECAAHATEVGAKV